MNKKILSGIALAGIAVPLFALSFNDVSPTNPYHDAIEYLKNKQVIKGYEDGNYRPNNTINRAEFIKIITEAQISQDDLKNCDTSKISLTDVPKNEWFAPHVCVGLKKNLIQGYSNNTYKPSQNINFAEAAKIISNGFELPTINDPVWYRPFVKNLERHRAIPLEINAFDEDITRGHMAEMIYRLHSDTTSKDTHTFEDIERGTTPEKPQTDEKEPSTETESSHPTLPDTLTIKDSNYGTETEITIDKAYRYIKTNSLPNHETGEFPNRNNPNSINAVNEEYRVPLDPTFASSNTDLGLHSFGVALNGVAFDPGAAEFWNNDRNSGWQYEALSGAINLGLDENNAHVQPTGAYHYHGMPTALVEEDSNKKHSSLLGFAADGFPIYGPYGYSDTEDSASSIKTLTSSYAVKSGTRPDGPGGSYDGTYVADYEYKEGKGDLDECNGRTAITPEYPKGTYYYVITESFPFIPRCFKGTIDESFLRQGGGGPGGPGGPGGRPPHHHRF